MERVHFQQEQMLDELKDLVEKNLFTEVCLWLTCVLFSKPITAYIARDKANHEETNRI